MGYCSDDHGFRSSGFHTSFGEFFTLDATSVQVQALNQHVEFLENVLGIRLASADDSAQGGESEESEGTYSLGDSTTGILAIIGIYGILQGYQAYEGYRAFVSEFDEGDYFEAGAFLGKAVIDVAALAYLVLLAIQISEAGRRQ